MAQKRNWKYWNRTQNEINSVFNDITQSLNDVINSLPTVPDKVASLDKLSVSEEWENFADKTAKRIISIQSKDDAKTWMQAATRATKGRQIYQMLSSELKSESSFQPLVLRSAELIRTLPNNISRKVVKKVGILTLKGVGEKDIAREIQKMFPNYTKASAMLIARTETARTQTAITTIRSNRLGLRWYIWRTVGGPLVRSSHRHMDGVLIPYGQDPEPEKLIGMKSQGSYKPGGIYNCRCYMEPVTNINDIAFPAKVFWNGRIQRMTKKQFLEIF